MEHDPALYDVAINEVHNVLTEHDPLVNPDALWATATVIVNRLVEEDLIIKPSLCEWRNPENTADCQRPAPLTKSYCYQHGNY